MQDVTVCPFRVVDEINQGMDPINERKVFMQLVESACRPGTPQCFLLTPKLLPALPFTPAVQVLQIWNGSTIKKVSGCFDQVSNVECSPAHALGWSMCQYLCRLKVKHAVVGLVNFYTLISKNMLLQVKVLGSRKRIRGYAG